MKEGWKEIEFGTIASFRNGLNFNKDSHGKGVLIIGVPNFQDYFKPRYETLGEVLPDGILKKEDFLEVGDILFVRSNGNKLLVGRSLFIDKAIKAVFSGFCIRARIDNKNALPIFYAYITRTKRFRALLSAASGGTNIQNLNQGILNKVKVPSPPIKTQRKIASILSGYDDLIENNLKRIKLLEEQAQQTYEEWFVRMKFPGHETAEFVADSGLPVGFNIEKFEDYFTINNGYAFKSGDYKKEGVKILRTRDYSQTKWVNMDQSIYISNKKSEEYQKYYVKAYDLMLIMVGASIGNYGIVLPKDLGVLQNQNQWAIRAKNLDYDFYKILMMEDLIKTLINKKTGAARDFFRASFLKEMSVVIPNEKIIRRFNEIINPIYSNINNLFSQSQLLKEARDILLPRLMNGMIGVSEITTQDIKNI